MSLIWETYLQYFIEQKLENYIEQKLEKSGSLSSIHSSSRNIDRSTLDIFKVAKPVKFPCRYVIDHPG